MAGQGPARRRRASRLHPVRIAVLTLFCLLLSGTAGAAAYFFPVVVAGVGQTSQTVVVPPSRSPGASATPTPAAAPGAPFTVLLLGSADEDPGTGRADYETRHHALHPARPVGPAFGRRQREDRRRLCLRRPSRRH